MICIDPMIYKGRPQTLDGRLPREVRTYQMLDELEIPYERVDHRRLSGYRKIAAHRHLQKSVPSQQPENQILSADDAGSQKVSDKPCVQADSESPFIFCGARVYGAVSGYHPRLR